MPEITHQFDVQINNAVLSAISGDFIDLAEENLILNFSLYEDMFSSGLAGSVLVKDITGWSDKFKLFGGEDIFFSAQSGEGDDISFPLFKVIGVTVDESDLVHGKKLVIDFTTSNIIEKEYSSVHLSLGDPDDPFYGDVSELARDLIAQYGGQQLDAPEIEDTANKIYYKRDQGFYPSLRRNKDETLRELITQLAENAVAKDNTNAVNFVFYQDARKWNFRSINSMVQQEPVKKFRGGFPKTAENENDRIINIKVKRVGNPLDSHRNAGLASTMSYYRPQIDLEKYEAWYADSVDTIYYRVNCRFKDHFPAAIYGFEQVETNKWKYAFAEVYIVGGDAGSYPSFRIKPLEFGAIRSSLEFTQEEGVNDTGDHFKHPAYNMMESGNDGYYDYEIRRGWEGPGYRLDTELWEKSCFKIQPIRGSHTEDGPAPAGPDGTKNYVDDQVLEGINDDFIVNGKVPVVDIKIYYNNDGTPVYAFHAANAVDGECTEEENGDCKNRQD